MVIHPSGESAIVFLPDTKMSSRSGVYESVVIDEPDAIFCLKRLVRGKAKHEYLMTVSLRHFRNMLHRAVVFFGLSHVKITTHSFRRGGATCLFLESGNYDRTVARGRWQSHATARIYIHEGMQSMVEFELSKGQRIALAACKKWAWVP